MVPIKTIPDYLEHHSTCLKKYVPKIPCFLLKMPISLIKHMLKMNCLYLTMALNEI